jgi:hypothetical protein
MPRPNLVEWESSANRWFFIHFATFSITMQATQARNEIQRIRGPALSVLAKCKEGLPMEEAIIKADSVNSVMAPNRRLSLYIGSEEIWERRACAPGASMLDRHHGRL